MALEPQWSVSDLAEHKKVNAATLHMRAKKIALPEPLKPAGSGFNSGIFRRQAARYKRSDLLAWFDAVEAVKTIKRIA